MKILIDTREQAPFLFMGTRYEGITTEKCCLPTGDYSLAGLEDKAAIERKSLDDLIMCLGKERERFKRELTRAKGYSLFAVVVEASWQDMARGCYQSKFNPHSACQSVSSFIANYRIPFLFAGSRAGAEYLCWSLLRQYLEGKRLQAILKAHDAAS